MPNPYFQFKKFTVYHDQCAMKVTTDACIFGAWAAQLIRNSLPGNAKMLDIGTGTGLLSLMIAQENPALQVDAVEVDDGASKQATANVKGSYMAAQIEIIPGDIHHMSFVNRYDCIVCNPPFYENELRSPHSAKNIAHHDEGLLLDQLLPLIRDALVPEGQFYLLLPYKRKDEIEQLFTAYGLHIKTELLVRATEDHSHSRVCYQGMKRNAASRETEDLIIRDKNGRYTDKFVALLKSFYLHL